MKQTIARVIDRIHENHCLRAAMFAMGGAYLTANKVPTAKTEGYRLSWRCRPGEC